MTSTPALAAHLQSMDDQALASALQRRVVTFTGRGTGVFGASGATASGIHDFFDLADALLEPESVQTALTQRDRLTLAGLWALAERRMTRAALAQELDVSPALVDDIAETMIDLLLAGEESGELFSYAEVGVQLRRWPDSELPDPRHLKDPFPPTESSPLPDRERKRIDHLAAEHAFSAVTAVNALLHEIARQPARLLSTGLIGIPELRRLAHAAAISEPATQRLLEIAEHAGLLTRGNSHLRISDEPSVGRSVWLKSTASERWLHMVNGWTASQAVDILGSLAKAPENLGDGGLKAWLSWRYPAGGHWLRENIGSALEASELLGISAEAVFSSPARALASADTALAATLLMAQLPAPVERLYLQADLTAVATGPLAADLDARMREMADAEGRAIASSYRLTATSVSRAIAGGDTAATILEFLGSIALTGIPQPLRYLIDEVDARHGLLRVGQLADVPVERGESVHNPHLEMDAVTYIRSDDHVLLGTVLVDQSLRGLGLTALSGHARDFPDDLASNTLTAIASIRPLPTVFWALAEARYPVAAEDALGHIVPVPREELSESGPDVGLPQKPNPIARLIERLRQNAASTSGDTRQAWLQRQLEGAIRSKTSVTVRVRMPNGALVDYRLEPTSVAGGRLRARDDVAQVERTLPLSSIAEVTTG